MAFYNELLKFKNNIALIENGREITYGDLQTQINEFRKCLPSRTLAFCVCSNTASSLVGYLGFLQAGIAAVLLNESLSKELFFELVSNYQPQLIWAPEGYTQGDIRYSDDSYTLIKTEYANSPALHHDLALLLTTSGSTGSPKLVRQSYHNIENNAESIAKYLLIEETDRAITTLPMSYTYGLSIINSHLLMGALIILTEHTLIEKAFWETLKENRATTFGGVPYTYEMLKRLRFFRMELPSLKYITQAGGKLGKELHLEFARGCLEKGIKFIVMYGQTEATARMSYVPADMSVEKAGSIGIAIPGGEFSLVDVNGKKINKTDVVGELVYRGDNVTLGYANSRKDLALGNKNKGVLATGDMAKRDSDGYYYIVGRKKRFLKIFGNRVNLDEVEGLLKKHGFTVACVGEDDHMIIYITSDDMASALDIVTVTTGLNHHAFCIKHIDEIPRNEAGKVLYSALE